jgi:hypothetical protein
MTPTYARRLARIGDRITYTFTGAKVEHAATITDLTESSIWLDDGTFLLRSGVEYDLVGQNVFVR